MTVPLLSCANWGGQGIHPRGNFNGFVEAGSSQKWLEAHGDSHWSLFSAGYGLALQKRFFDYFLKGIDNGWDANSRACSSTSAIPANNSCCAAKTNGRSRARSGPNSISIPAGMTLSRRRSAQEQAVDYERWATA